MLAARWRDIHRVCAVTSTAITCVDPRAATTLQFGPPITARKVSQLYLKYNPIGRSVKSKLDEISDTVQNRNGNTIIIWTS